MFDSFNRKWIKKNQKLLLWFLNVSVIKYWFHFILGITGQFNYSYCMSLPQQVITEIGGNYFKIGGAWNKIKGFLSERSKLSTRVWIAFFPIWFTLYVWELIVNIPFLMMQYLSGKRRYKPIIHWSNKSFVHNIFRVWEMVFGADARIKPQITTFFDGETAVSQAHSFEGALALIETSIRGFLESFKLPVRVWIPQLSSPEGLPLPKAGFMFAIAHDANGSSFGSQGSDPKTFSHTCTGSNLALTLGVGMTNIGLSGASCSYNGVSMSIANSSFTNSNPFGRQYVLAGPATGANTVSFTVGGTNGSGSICIITSSYTGVDQSTTTGNTGTVNGDSITITPTYANSMLVDFISDGANNTITPGGSQTQTAQGQGTGSNALTCASSYLLLTTITSYTVSWSGDSFSHYGVFELKAAAVLPETINVSDTTNISDTVTVEIIYSINKSDTTAITDSVSVDIADTIKVSDTTTITDTRSIDIADCINVSDTTNITDSTKMELVDKINVSDTTNITDSATIEIFSYINVSDNTAITDSATIEIISFINKSETTTITDNVTIEIVDQGINVSDTTVLSNNASVEIVYLINVSDTTAITDSSNLEIFSFVNVSDTTIITDSANLEIISYINVSDISNITDSVNIELFNTIGVSDTTPVSDSEIIEIISYINTSETSPITDSAIVLNPIEYLLVSDNTPITDAAFVEEIEQGAFGIDLTIMSDQANLTVSPPSPNISDTTVVSDNAALEIMNPFNVSDVTVVSDNAIIELVNTVAVFDTTPISDSVIIEEVDEGLVVSDITTITDSVQIAVVYRIDEGDLNPRLGWHQANYVLEGDPDDLELSRSDLNKNYKLIV